jgi:tight adherence protein B
VRRARAILGFALLGALVALAGGTASADPSTQLVRIRGVDLAHYPSVDVTVAVQGSTGTLTIALRENDAAVTVRKVTPIRQAGRSVDVVLAIDTSNSMEGQPLAAALAAAGAFVAKLPADIPVGLVTFDDSPTIRVPVTADHAAVMTALGSLQTHRNTALFDAVATSAGMFSGDAQHNIVVLTDGADVGSRLSLEQAAQRAVDAKATVFAVGLASKDFSAPPLEKLADLTKGVYSPAAQADLSRLYEDLATELAQQYVVTYQTAAARGTQLTLRASVGSASDTAVALTPAAPPKLTAPNPLRIPFVHGTAGLLLVLALAFGALFLLLVLGLGARARKRKDRVLADRMAMKKEAGEEITDADRPSMAWIPEPILTAAGRVADAGGVSANLDRKLERAGLPIRAAEFVVATVLAAVGGALLGAIVGGWLFVVLFSAAGALIPTVLLPMAVNKREKKLHAQLADTLMILASSLRAGHSFFQALDTVSKEIGEPAGSEFGRVVGEIRLGRPVNEAMNAMAERVGSDDFKWAMLAVSVQREVGGNLAEVLETVSETVRERDAVRRQIDVLSAEGRFSIWILALLPFLVGAYIAKVNPGYLNVLFTNPAGQVMLAVAGCLLILGIFWMKKIVRIDV